MAAHVCGVTAKVTVVVLVARHLHVEHADMIRACKATDARSRPTTALMYSQNTVQVLVPHVICFGDSHDMQALTQLSVHRMVTCVIKPQLLPVAVPHRVRFFAVFVNVIRVQSDLSHQPLPRSNGTMQDLSCEGRQLQIMSQSSSVN